MHAQSIDISKVGTTELILSKCQIYIDKNNSYKIEDAISNKIPFQDITMDTYSLGFSPKLSAWISCKLKNSSTQRVDKTLNYNHPIESHIYFYDSKDDYRQITKGDFHRTKDDRFLTHILRVSLEPNEERNIFINTIGHETATIFNLELWEHEALESKNQDHQLMLAIFFGAIGALVIYNFSLFLFVRDYSYFYYACYALGMLLHQSFYTGMTQLHILDNPSFMMTYLFVFLLVCFPTISAILFTRSFFETRHKYKKIDAVLIFWIMLTLFMIPFGLSDESYASTISIFVSVDVIGVYLSLCGL